MSEPKDGPVGPKVGEGIKASNEPAASEQRVRVGYVRAVVKAGLTNKNEAEVWFYRWLETQRQNAYEAGRQTGNMEGFERGRAEGLMLGRAKEYKVGGEKFVELEKQHVQEVRESYDLGREAGRADQNRSAVHKVYYHVNPRGVRGVSQWKCTNCDWETPNVDENDLSYAQTWHDRWLVIQPAQESNREGSDILGMAERITKLEQWQHQISNQVGIDDGEPEHTLCFQSGDLNADYWQCHGCDWSVHAAFRLRDMGSAQASHDAAQLRDARVDPDAVPGMER